MFMIFSNLFCWLILHLELLIRSRNVPSFSPNSYITKRQKVGLMMLDYYNPSEEAPILFKTRNATKSIAALPKSAVDSKGKSLADESETPTTILLPKPCLVSSNYLNSPNHSLNVRVGSGSQRPNPIDINPVPLTTCVKHGTSGFLPLDYARRFPEYTCTIHKFPVAKVIHGFDDCVLEFPDDQTAISSPTWRHYEQDIIDVNVKKCCRCNKKLSDKKDIFMYRYVNAN